MPDEIDRRDMIKAIALGSATMLPLLPLIESGAAAAPTTPYSARFFSASEMELVAALGEIILPQTDTPGARAAKVHEHIDVVLSQETADVQEEFRDGTAWLERRSRETYGRGFMALSPEQQTAILKRISDSKTVRPEDEAGARFFLDIRKRVVFGYYTSEIGLRQELTYKGKQVLEHWEGCPHPDKHGDAA
jgi:gluconate 2-dehydrogenase gamma chain